MNLNIIKKDLSQSHVYRILVRKKICLLLFLALLLILNFLLDLALGPANYDLWDIAKALIMPNTVPVQLRVVLWDIRMPMALMALLVGAALSVSGAQMQTILNNPLASPFTLGIAAAASFGAALGLVFGLRLFPILTEYMISINAFIMALFSACMIYLLSLRRGVRAETLVLLGIAMVFTFNSLLALVQYFSHEQAVAAVVFWTMGSLMKTTWPKVAVVFSIFILTLPLLIKRVWALTALRLGDEKAQSLGINVKNIRLEILLLVSLLASIPISFVGAIGFIGLVGPHIARMLIGEDQRFFMPASLLTGALLLSISSVVSKLLIPGIVVPIGVVTSLIGIPFFVTLILHSRRNTW
ncbi:FecCD family ABC transporter permease [Candidatus Williamhamiltonella defendens]|uniref:Iron-siderophore ABC transporter permease n=1 Tax=Candidatus Hamiltonella defensa (Bemisia tabaci) TaxID=672795 RepID=A0A249DZ02_9ENTR|nr:iron ABC transporter permease [Candidatus Hamiltonella defensa]ASX26589.1 iron-siderophore ABC transporter permease [Candidatus Hamiltonella defensa (Bemisia tabaci)]CED78392.1 Iron ABC transport system, permease protein [Candidatus Hamiltonella defensa (Bemisia tabaci)]